MIYGMVLLGCGVGAVLASYIGGYFVDMARATNPNVIDINVLFIAFIISSVTSLVGAVLMFFAKHQKVKSEAIKN